MSGLPDFLKVLEGQQSFQKCQLSSQTMLYAIGDLHLSFPSNQDEWQKLKPHPDDGLILCGDVGEKAEHLDLAFSIAKQNFKEVFWCPGNHELYSLPVDTSQRGEAKYAECLAVAARHGVHTPEDATADALAWAEEAETVATDEAILFPDPHPSREAWCAALVEKTEAKLAAAAIAAGDVPLVIVNHWPLREDLVFIPRVPRFILWCGTKRTEDWHVRFNACVVVSGHLHVPRTDWKDGVRFEECSLGYPREWKDVRESGHDINDLLRVIWPGPPPPATGTAATQWRRWG
ncbi:Metallo-dependent phosphatase-like protein [Mycena olivaceomarginata]|nr:Metallo-dependent phosphatase-like protein [Mycena olivaceomarginata]